MIIARFGAQYNTAYQFPILRSLDDWQTQRPAVIQQVGGMNGVFDFYGSGTYPLSAIVLRKSFALSARAPFQQNAYADVELLLNTIRTNVLGAGEQKMWGVTRDNSVRWAWAKCTSLRAPESYNNKLSVPVDLEFMLREGVWYGAEQSGTSLTHLMSYPLTLTNNGNLPADVVLHITSATGTITSLTLANSTNGYTCTWTGSATFGQSLRIDTGAWSVTKASAGAYSGLTYGATQERWFRLQPGNNVVSLTVVGSTNWSGSLTWWDTYLL
jgi:hypothetical protein